MPKRNFQLEPAAIGSLVVLIASISATGALASARANPEGLDRDLSARVASVAATIAKHGPPGLRDGLGSETKVAQWRNAR